MRSRRTIPVLVLMFVSLFLMQCELTLCSSSTEYEKDTTHPKKAYNPYPSDLSTGQSKTPVFYWECDPPDTAIILTYEFILWQTGHEEDAITVKQLEKTYTYESELAEQTDYSWQVNVSTQYDLRVAGDIWRFTTGSGYNNPPLPPVPIIPVSNWAYSNTFNTDVTFEWTCIDPDGDDLTYDVLLGPHEGTIVPFNEGLSEAFCQHPSLEYSTIYDWQVIAHDAESSSDPSEVVSFMTTSSSNHCPTEGVYVYPEDMAVGVPIDVNLYWRGADADGDDLWYTVRFGDETIVENSRDSTYLVEGLEYNTTYEWRIQEVYDGICKVSNTPASYFTTMLDPSSYNGIYAELIVSRSQYFSNDELTRNDFISARFDSVYSPDVAQNPLRPASVTYDTGGPVSVPMPWDDYWSKYYKDNQISGYFLSPGSEYYFHVSAGDGVPSLERSIQYPECRPYITSPQAYSNVTLEGLELVWTDYDAYPDCDRNVTIRIQDMSMLEWTDVLIVTDNDGSYTFTADDVSGIDPMAYQLMIVLIVSNKEYIIEPGYDPRSFIEARTWATQMVNTF